MILSIAGSPLVADEVDVSQFGGRSIIGPFGRWHGNRRYMQVNGIVRASSASSLKTLMDARYSDTGTGYFNGKSYSQSVTLYQNDGSTVHHQLVSSGSRNGVKCKDFRWHNPPYGSKAQGLHYRSYTAMFEADYPDDSQSEYFMFKETIAQIGTGGRDFRIQESMTGTPIDQTTKTYTGFQARQYGSAIGLLNWPTPPSPFAVGSLVPKSSYVETSSPEWPGLVTDMLFGVRWNYLFAGTTLLSTTPTIP